MAIRKIIRIEEPSKGDKFHGGLYHIWVEGIEYQPWAMYECQLNMLKFEIKMLEAGVTEEMIEKHRELVIAHTQEEISLDGECG